MLKQLMTGIELISPPPALSYSAAGRERVLSMMLAGGKILEEPPPAPLNHHRAVLWVNDVDGFEVSLEWAIPEISPYILWRWSFRNDHEHPITLNHANVLACANAGYIKRRVQEDLFLKMPRDILPRNLMGFNHPGTPHTIAVYLPGWQSWSYGGWLMADDHFPRSWLRPLTLPMSFESSKPFPRSRGHFRSEMFAGFVDTDTETSICVGYLSQVQSFGTVDFYIGDDARALSVWMDLDNLQLDPGDSFSSDWAFLILNENGMAVVDDFAVLAGEFNQARIPMDAAVGWCSWYDYGQDISEAKIKENISGAVAARDQIPMSVIQIDDGFQADIGDWLNVGLNFSSGMQPLAEDIRGAGFTAGLWLAPFIALSSSSIVKDHPDWILRNRWGLPVNTGWVWNQFGRAFDLTHPDFIDYLQRVIFTAINDWGYQYLKLDFLYAGVLPGVRNNIKVTRAQAFQEALRLIREIAGDTVTLVGCGCPLGPGIGIFDSMRIGPDVAASWKPSYPPFSKLLTREPTLPAAVNAIRNTINRAPFHRQWWINDPDCLLMRKDNSDLSVGEIQSLATAIGMSGGNLMLSDRLGSMSPDRLEMFGFLIPPLPGQMRLVSVKESHDFPVVLQEFCGASGEWWLIASFNTCDAVHHSTLQLNEILPFSGDAHVFDVWNESYKIHNLSMPFDFDTEAHQVTLFAIRPVGHTPAWIGDKVHLSQGLIIDEWQPGKETLTVKIKPHRKCEVRCWIYLPGEIRSANFNKVPVVPEIINGLLLFTLRSFEDGVLEIQWSEANNDH